MRARPLAVLAAMALIASACQAATPSSAPPATSGPATDAPATPEPSTPTVLRVARISDFLPSIHPVNLGTGNQELMADIVFSTLVDVDSDEVTILPDLATEWTASPDATIYTFKLNPAAVWSDGEPVTVDDVIFTIAWSTQNPTAFKQIRSRGGPTSRVARTSSGRRTSPRASRRSTITRSRSRSRSPTPRSCARSPAPSTTSCPSTSSTS